MREIILRLYDQFYTQFSWCYDVVTWLGSGGLWKRWTLVAADAVAGEAVLEVGYGRGHLLAHLANRGHRLCGIDRSAQMARATQKRLGARRSHVLLLQGSGDALPLQDGSIGTLITTFPAPYVSLSATQHEFARVLRPGGCWIWIDAPIACRPTPRMVLLGIMSWLGGISAALRPSLGLGAGPIWSPVLAPSVPFHGTVERVHVGVTAVHCARFVRIPD